MGQKPKGCFRFFKAGKAQEEKINPVNWPSKLSALLEKYPLTLDKIEKALSEDLKNNSIIQLPQSSTFTKVDVPSEPEEWPELNESDELDTSQIPEFAKKYRRKVPLDLTELRKEYEVSSLAEQEKILNENPFAIIIPVSKPEKPILLKEKTSDKFPEKSSKNINIDSNYNEFINHPAIPIEKIYFDHNCNEVRSPHPLPKEKLSEKNNLTGDLNEEISPDEWTRVIQKCIKKGLEISQWSAKEILAKREEITQNFEELQNLSKKKVKVEKKKLIRKVQRF